MKNKIVAGLLLIVIIILFFLAYKISYPKFEVYKTETYVVSKGDTIWEIASRYMDEGIDIRKYICMIYEYNDGLSPIITEGQAIVIPRLSKFSMNKQ